MYKPNRYIQIRTCQSFYIATRETSQLSPISFTLPKASHLLSTSSCLKALKQSLINWQLFCLGFDDKSSWNHGKLWESNCFIFIFFIANLHIKSKLPNCLDVLELRRFNTLLMILWSKRTMTEPPKLPQSLWLPPKFQQSKGQTSPTAY